MLEVHESLAVTSVDVNQHPVGSRLDRRQSRRATALPFTLNLPQSPNHHVGPAACRHLMLSQRAVCVYSARQVVSKIAEGRGELVGLALWIIAERALGHKSEW